MTALFVVNAMIVPKAASPIGSWRKIAATLIDRASGDRTTDDPEFVGVP